MLESKLAADFMQMFERFAPVAIANHSVGGWPDRMLQEQYTSRVCFSELKVCTVADDVLVDLRADQAAWLYKWQRNGGKCFLYLGMCNKQGRLEYYGIYVAQTHKDWLQIPTHKVPLTDIKLLLDDKQVRRWFTNYMKLVS